MNSESHAIEKIQLLQELKTTEKGLSTQEAEQRLEKYGLNELVAKKATSDLTIFLRQFKDIFVIMLRIGIGISIAINELPDAGIIGVSVIVNAIVGFGQEYR